MRFIYGKQDMRTPEQAQENCYLLANGLGGYSSLSAAYSVTRNDQGILIAASTAPTVRNTLVQRIQEKLLLGEKTYYLSTQEFEGEASGLETDPKQPAEDGYTHLTTFVWEDRPRWTYEVGGLTVTREIAVKPGTNLVNIHYEIINHAEEAGLLILEPAFLCAPKGHTLQEEDILSAGALDTELAPCASLKKETNTAEAKHPEENDMYHAVWNGESLAFRGYHVYIRTDAQLAPISPVWEHVHYRHDVEDGRTCEGYLLRCLRITAGCDAGSSTSCDILLSDRPISGTRFSESEQKINGDEKQADFGSGKALDVPASVESERTQVVRLAADVRQSLLDHIREQKAHLTLQDPTARQLAMAADAYITRRDSTGGKTIVAGYPFFADWGRDTMISLPGCVLSTNRMEDAESILRTFLEYEKDGLVPNLFPEGGEEPRYNTVDAALLLINSVWEYYQRTGKVSFLREAYPVMERIIAGYRRGTHHGIMMDRDGLIKAGQGLDQVTWMDVCVEGILPTPRHGKPVEINAYWYNALCIMAEASTVLATDYGLNQGNMAGAIEGGKSTGIAEEAIPTQHYEEMARKVKASFLQKFWLEEQGYLRDVISTDQEPAQARVSVDDQFRCNQIWAITLPYTMLSQEQERRVVENVYRRLYTPCGLRTLDLADPQFHPTYGGPQKQRDLAYHQGTVWVFPLGAFYKAYLKVNYLSNEAKEWVRDRLMAIEPMLREGCIGQLPEIYDGANPGSSKGCFAQAWSVGEILSVYEMIHRGRG